MLAWERSVGFRCKFGFFLSLYGHHPSGSDEVDDELLLEDDEDDALDELLLEDDEDDDELPELLELLAGSLEAVGPTSTILSRFL